MIQPANATVFQRNLTVNQQTFTYYSITAATELGLGNFNRLPYSLKILLENTLRHLDGKVVKAEDIHAFSQWLQTKTSQKEIAYYPARVLMQDFTGVPGVADLACMRDAMQKLNRDPQKIKPLIPVDLVIDHSVQVDHFGSKMAFSQNVELEMKRNHERYTFLRWGQNAFNNFRVVPPGTGICHQVNLENLAQVIYCNGQTLYPDTLVGTDSHTTMVNGLGVLGWGVGGIEAEAAMLGQPISMLLPEVVGFKLEGRLSAGITATDLVLTITQMLRQKGVVGKFVEFYGPGLQDLPLADRATIANMAPEYGATCGFFPIDHQTLAYLQLTGRGDLNPMVEAYAKAQGLWCEPGAEDPVFTSTLNLNLNTVEASLAGPKRPQDRVTLKEVKAAFAQVLTETGKSLDAGVAVAGEKYALKHGDVVIAAITSCTNTSNPSVLIAAGLLARNALAYGLQCKPWVKTSLAPGSQVVTDYLEKTGLQTPLNDLGFNLVGYGCTTCIGNSGPLSDPITDAIQKNQLQVSAVLSGNRNFEGRVHPLVKANWLASPPLVVAYALAGTVNIDLVTDPLGHDSKGQPVYLKDVWPAPEAIAAEMAKIDEQMYRARYANVFAGDAYWQNIQAPQTATYVWENESTYVRRPPFFDDFSLTPKPLKNIENARILALLGDSITTDHISPAGAIKADSPAGKYLQAHHVPVSEFNSYGARRGNHEVMMRGTFANTRLKNEMAPDKEGGFTRYIPDNSVQTIYDAAMQYQQTDTPLVIFAGKEYGTGSSRDWAAKGTLLLGVKAVLAESFERIHRSNLIGMGILPLEFLAGQSRKTLQLTGNEKISMVHLTDGVQAGMKIPVLITRENGQTETVMFLCRIDTDNEAQYYLHGGILQYVLRHM